MDNAKVVELAKRAGLQLNVYAEAYPVIAGQLGRFADLVAAAEREACAEECEAIARKYNEQFAVEHEHAADECVEAVRSRGK